MNEEKKCWRLRRPLLLMKIHFFFLFGGIGGVEPYKALLGKGIGISASAVGLCITVSLLLASISKPIIGYLSNYFQALKCFCMCLLIMSVLTSQSMLFIPTIEPTELKNEVDFYKLEDFKNNAMNSTVNELQNQSNSHQFTSEKPIMTTIVNSEVWISNNHFVSSSIENKTEAESVTSNSTAKLYSDIYHTYQFWMFFTIVIMFHISTSNVSYLSDVICYNILDNKKTQYGLQRLWGTIGWALICFLSGYLNDLSTGNQPDKDYSPGFYLMLVLILLDMIIFYNLPVHTKPVNNISTYNIAKILRSCEIITFAVGAVCIGVFVSFVNNFEFWYLQDLGASQTLLGSTIFVQCLGGEVPFFILSGWFIEKFGCFNTFLASLVGFGIRFSLYYIIQNPWWALGIDLTHGLTFALWHTSMTTFASNNSPDGLEGAMFGVFDGLTYSFGTAIGSSLCGLGIDSIGGRRTLGIFSIAAFICASCFWSLNRLRTTQ